jgi:YD repeat-containing protein
VTTALGAAAYIESTLSTPLGEVQSLTYPDGYSVSYSYQNGLLRGVSSGSGMIAEVDTYSPLGVPSAISYGANIDRSMVYDKDVGMRLSRDTLQVGSTTLSDRTYTYDPDGNLTQLSQTGSSPLSYTGNYTYDDLSRLTGIGVSGSGVSVNESYTYDLVSNRLTGPSGVSTIGGSAGLAPGVAKSQLYRLSHDGSRGMEYDTK